MTNLKKRVIPLNPLDVREETRAALKDEIIMQTDEDLDDIEFIDTLVLDSNEDGGLDSHATVFTSPSGGDA